MQVKQGAGDKCEIEVEFKGEMKRFSPEEISSMVLIKMKETAEAFIGQEVKQAVITVPACAQIYLAFRLFSLCVRCVHAYRLFSFSNVFHLIFIFF